MGGKEAAARRLGDIVPPVITVNPDGQSPFVLVCDHASNRIPKDYGHLGLSLQQRLMHIAWDPGALAVALELSALLDAPLIQSTVSRLVIDCNRDHDAVDLIPIVSERTDIPGNVGIGANDKANRIAAFHAPFHDAITALLDARMEQGRETILVTVHSFTPTYKDTSRPWPIGLIHGTDERFSRAFEAELKADPAAGPVGWNEPYSARNGVTHTLEFHGDGRGLDATMIEIRHNGILEQLGVTEWAERISRCLTAARQALRGSEPKSVTGASAVNHSSSGA